MNRKKKKFINKEIAGIIVVILKEPYFKFVFQL